MKNRINIFKLSIIFLTLLSTLITSCKKDTPEPVDETMLASNMAIVSGNNQTSVIGTALASPIVVIVKDQEGNAFKSASVKFQTANGSVSSATVTTDTEGKATVSWTLGETEGSQALTVTVFKADGTTALSGSPITINATGSAVEPVNLALYSGGGQRQTVKNILAEPIIVQVTDHNGNSFAGVTVHFAVSEGSISTATAITDEYGLAEVEWTLGSTEGMQNLTVTAFKADGITALAGSPNVVTAYGDIGVATALSVFSGNNQTDETGSSLGNAAVIQVKDQNGRPFAGTTVSFSVSEGSVASASVITDAQGLAETGWILGSTVGTQTLTITAFKADGTTPLNNSPLEFTATATAPSVSIGDFANGGVVFYILQSGDTGYDTNVQHGFVCTVSDQSVSAVWGCSLNAIAGADGTAIGTGEQNTTDMGAVCGTSGVASELCLSLTLNSYSDWFLPSKDELIAMYQSRVQVNSTATNNGGSNFDVNWFYSTSSETAANTAFIKRFDASGAEGSSNKGTGYRIRAIRAF